MANSASSNELHSITKHNNIVISGVGANEVLKFDGSNWINQTLPESGIAPVASPTFTTGATSPAWITGNSGTIKLVDGDGNHFTTIAAHATTVADVAYTWPNNAPSTSGFALTSTTGGEMSWAAAGGDFSNGGDDGALVLGTNDANSLTFETTNTARMVIAAGGDVSIAGGSKFILDGAGGNTYFTDDTDTVNLYVGGVHSQRWDNSGGSIYELHYNVQSQFSSGTQSAPGICFRSHTPTGFYYISANNIGVSGNLKFDSGEGLDFSATANSSGSMSSELLDDYEEGTWSPEVWDNSDDDGSTGYTAQYGSYVKIGNHVFFSAYFQINGSGLAGMTTTQYAKVGNLPFTAVSTSNSYASVHFGYMYGLYEQHNADTTHLAGYVAPGYNYISVKVYHQTNSVLTPQCAIFAANVQIMLSGHYQTAT